MPVISIVNHKGGVGKSTTTVNLAHALANKGKKVLVWDQDPQANSTSILLPMNAEGSKTLYDLYKQDTPCKVQECIYKTAYENLFVLPNSPKSARLEPILYKNMAESYQLTRNYLSHVKEYYDYVFFDNCPSLGLFTLQSLIASDCVIIPVEAGSRYAIEGLLAAIDAIDSVSSTANPNLRFLRLLMNLVDLRTSVSRTSLDFIKDRFGDSKVFKTAIPQNTQIKQAENEGKTVLRHAPQSVGAKRFRDLADEVISLIEGEQPGLEL